MIWIGDRTRQPDHAHVEYCRGIKNPLGLKCGPSLAADGLLRADRPAQPRQRARPADADRPLRLRQGRRASAEADARGAEARAAAWSGRAIPMHGNTITLDGYKTRPFDRILKEVQTFFDVHRAEGTHPGGIHVEMTGKNVTECTGGARAITAEDLHGPLSHPLRPAPQCRPGDRAGVPGLGPAEEEPSGAAQAGCQRLIRRTATDRTRGRPRNPAPFSCWAMPSP